MQVGALARPAAPDDEDDDDAGSGAEAGDETPGGREETDADLDVGGWRGGGWGCACAHGVTASLSQAAVQASLNELDLMRNAGRLEMAELEAAIAASLMLEVRGVSVCVGGAWRLPHGRSRVGRASPCLGAQNERVRVAREQEEATAAAATVVVASAPAELFSRASGGGGGGGGKERDGGKEGCDDVRALHPYTRARALRDLPRSARATTTRLWRSPRPLRRRWPLRLAAGAPPWSQQRRSGRVPRLAPLPLRRLRPLPLRRLRPLPPRR